MRGQARMSLKWVRIAAAAVSGIATLMCLDLATVSAQTISNSTVSSILQSLGQTAPSASPLSSGGVPPPAAPIVVQPSVTTSAQTLMPATAPTAAQLPASTLELMFSQRLGQPLQQFGYDMFGVGSPVPVTQVGGVQDAYILGAGDQLSIVNRGHDNNSYIVPVDRDGRVIVPGYPPVQAGGRTFAEVRHDLISIIAKDALQTQSYITLAQTRQISVIVSGEVNAPGVRTLSGLNTPIDALLLSGGIRKTGSLRNIVLVRGSRHIAIDLYSVLARGNLSAAGNLTEGDHIVVAPIGATVAVTGLVNRPGIYELPPGTRAMGGQALIRLAGGGFAGANHLSRIELESTGRTRLVSLGHDGIVRSGEILSVDQQASGSEGGMALAGAVQLPGTRAINKTTRVSHLMGSANDLSPIAYTPFAILVHRDGKSGVKHASAFSLAKVFEGTQDFDLYQGDLVFVLTNDQARALAAAAAAQLQAAAQAGSVPPNVVTQALSASNAAQQSSTISAVAAPTTTPVNNAAAIYAAANSSSLTGASNGVPSLSQVLASNPPPGTTSGNSAPTQTASASPAANPPASAPTPLPPSGPMIGVLPQPPSIPYDARLAAAASGQLPASVALLQAQSAQSAALGVPLQGGGLTVPSALGSPIVDTNPNDIAAELGITPAALINLAADYLVSVVGDVHDPGAYLADEGTPLGEMLIAAGGLQRQADLSWVEVTSTEIDASSGTSKTVRNAYKGNTQEDFNKVALRPLDTVRVRQVFADRESGTVTIVGQVRYPGSFDILRNERLSSLIARAGGLTDEAYPYGSVYTRISAQQAEAAGNYREAVELQTGALIAATTPNVNPGLLAYLQTLQQTLLHQPALGRISVQADPTVLSVKPQLDTLLQPGDFVYVPKRPSTISVSGEVLNPGSFQYRPGMSMNNYLDLAGGTTRTADEGSMFIILPDGTARPASSDFFDFFGDNPIPPGSTIVVPPDPAPFNTMVFMQGLTQILSQTATTAAALAVLSTSRNN